MFFYSPHLFPYSLRRREKTPLSVPPPRLYLSSHTHFLSSFSYPFVYLAFCMLSHFILHTRIGIIIQHRHTLTCTYSRHSASYPHVYILSAFLTSCIYFWTPIFDNSILFTTVGCHLVTNQRQRKREFCHVLYPMSSN
ncbi:hypothetical protein BJV82DRAFT_115461 [Fennellomyces sp. T-0311]|nr:hypothetical protein BJV82DRAFT_115461 [Fennellomyces sp. T-0311]